MPAPLQSNSPSPVVMQSGRSGENARTCHDASTNYVIRQTVQRRSARILCYSFCRATVHGSLHNSALFSVTNKRLRQPSLRLWPHFTYCSVDYAAGFSQQLLL